VRQNLSLTLPVTPTPLLDNFACRIARGVVDESGVLSRRLHFSTVHQAHISPRGWATRIGWLQFRDVVSPHRHDHHYVPHTVYILHRWSSYH
jgi:hypothetical protein